jgi:AcrR family transcriptional regulator
MPPDCQDEGVAQVRPYRGIGAADRLADRRSRLLQAGLDILGSKEDPSELTVRGICRQAGVTARYFYESFADKDELVAAVYDWVIGDIAASTQAAVSAAPRLQNRAAMANIVRTISEDPRVGRLLFNSELANSVLVRKRKEAGGLLTTLYGRDVGSALGVRQSERSKTIAHFAVAGVAQAFSAWLDGDVELEADELVDQLTAILDALTDPKLYRG